MLRSTPTDGASDDARSIWNEESSITWTRSGRGGASARIGVPILPPSSTLMPESAEKMRDQRRRRRFAVGAGNRDEQRARSYLRALAAKQLDVADNFDPGCACPRRPSRCGSGWSTARRATIPARRNRPNRKLVRSIVRPRRSRCVACLVAIVSKPRPRRRLRAARAPRAARTAETEHRDPLAWKAVTGDHRLHRTSRSTGRRAPARKR